MHVGLSTKAINNPHSPPWCQERASASCHQPGTLAPSPHAPASPCPREGAEFGRAKPSPWLLVHSEPFRREGGGTGPQHPAVPAAGGSDPPCWDSHRLCPPVGGLIRDGRSQPQPPQPPLVPSVRLLLGEPSLRKFRGSMSPLSPPVAASWCPPFIPVLFPREVEALG